MKNQTDIQSISPQTLGKLYFDSNCECCRLIDEKIIPVFDSQLDLHKRKITLLSDYEIALIELFYRLHCLFSSQTRLTNGRDFNAVAINCRSIFELMLDIQLLANNLIENGIEKYHSFTKIDRYLQARKLKKFEKQYPEFDGKGIFPKQNRDKFLDEKEAIIEKDLQDLWGKNSIKEAESLSHWSGINIYSRTQKIGKNSEHLYRELYTFLSSFTHAGNTATSGLSEDGLTGVYGISQNFSREFYKESFTTIARIFYLDKAIENFSYIQNFIENAPMEIIKEGLTKKP